MLDMPKGGISGSNAQSTAFVEGELIPLILSTATKSRRKQPGPPNLRAACQDLKHNWSLVFVKVTALLCPPHVKAHAFL